MYVCMYECVYVCAHVFYFQICVHYLLRCCNAILAAPSSSSLSPLCTAAQKLNSILIIPSGLAVMASFIVKRHKIEVKRKAVRKGNYHLFQVA